MKMNVQFRFDCRFCRPRLNAFAAGELDKNESLSVERHLQRCADCRAELAGLRRIADRLIDYASTNTIMAPSADLWNRIEAEIAPITLLPAPKRPLWQSPSTLWSGGLVAAASVGLLFLLLRGGSSVVALSANDVSTSKAIVIKAQMATLTAASESSNSGLAVSTIHPIVAVSHPKMSLVRVATVPRRRRSVVRLAENRIVSVRRRNRPVKTILLAADTITKPAVVVKPTIMRVALNKPKATEAVMTASESRPTTETSDFVTVANSDEPRAAQSNAAGAAVMVASRQMGLFSNLTR